MARPISRHPTELELEILKILWREGPSPGRAIRDALTGFRDLAYTSVMTVMKIMTQKKYVRRKKVDGNFVYYPCVSEETVAKRMLHDVVDRVFDGSAAAVMLNLLETADLDDEELRQLRETIGQKAKEQSP
jgi:BlaI family penicillinase repressor